MKKLKRIITLIVILLTVTGCVKMEISMDIKKDKSMNFGIIQAFDKSLLEQSEGSTNTLSEEQKKELEAQGYTIEKYSENDMEGYKITKEIKNIDEVSTEEEITADLGTSKLNDNEYLFTVKKGLFKNTYKATLKSSDTDEINNNLESGLTDDTTYDDTLTDDTDYFEDDIFTNDSFYDEDTTLDDNYTNDNTEDFDYSDLLSSMEMNMKVTLPYKALSNNATNVEDDGKTLTWDLMNFADDTIEFEFQLYNTNNIIIAIVIGALVILLIICLIVKKSNKKPKINDNQFQTNSVTEPTPENLTPTQETVVDNNITSAPANISEQPINNTSEEPVTENISTPETLFTSQTITEESKVISEPNNSVEITNNINNEVVNNVDNSSNINTNQDIISQVPLINPFEIENQPTNNTVEPVIESQPIIESQPVIEPIKEEIASSTSQSYDIFTMNLNKTNQVQVNETPTINQQQVPNNNTINQEQSINSSNPIFPNQNTDK